MLANASSEFSSAHYKVSLKMKLQSQGLMICQIDLTVSWLSIIIPGDLVEAYSFCFGH